MSNRPIVIALIVSAAINLVAIFTFGFYWSEALRHRNSPPSMSSPPAAGDRKAQLDRLREKFKLSDQQMDTIRVLDEVMRATMRPLQDTLSAKQEELLSLLKGPSFDQAQVDRLSQEVISLRASLETRSLGILLRMRNVLTSEQRIELGELFVAFRQPGRPPPSKDALSPAQGPPKGESPPQEPPPGEPGRRPPPPRGGLNPDQSPPTSGPPPQGPPPGESGR